MQRGECLVFAAALCLSLGFACAAGYSYAKERQAARDAALGIIPGAVPSEVIGPHPTFR